MGLAIYAYLMMLSVIGTVAYGAGAIFDTSVFNSIVFLSGCFFLRHIRNGLRGMFGSVWSRKVPAGVPGRPSVFRRIGRPFLGKRFRIRKTKFRAGNFENGVDLGLQKKCPDFSISDVNFRMSGPAGWKMVGRIFSFFGRLWGQSTLSMNVESVAAVGWAVFCRIHDVFVVAVVILGVCVGVAGVGSAMHGWVYDTGLDDLTLSLIHI